MPGHTPEARFRNKMRRRRAKEIKDKLAKEKFRESKRSSMAKAKENKVKQKLVTVKQQKHKVKSKEQNNTMNDFSLVSMISLG